MSDVQTQEHLGSTALIPFIWRALPHPFGCAGARACQRVRSCSGGCAAPGRVSASLPCFQKLCLGSGCLCGQLTLQGIPSFIRGNPFSLPPERGQVPGEAEFRTPLVTAELKCSREAPPLGKLPRPITFQFREATIQGIPFSIWGFPSNLPLRARGAGSSLAGAAGLRSRRCGTAHFPRISSGNHAVSPVCLRCCSLHPRQQRPTHCSMPPPSSSNNPASSRAAKAVDCHMASMPAMASHTDMSSRAAPCQ